MPIDRIEIAVECDDPMEDGLPALYAIAACLGLDPETDMDSVITATDEGTPVVFAVIAPDAGEDGSDG